MSTDPPYVPIIIVNWNGLTDTIECVDSVLRQDYPNYSIHLVDNGSDQNEGETLALKYQHDDRVYVYQSNENLGFTGANRMVVQELWNQKLKWIALLNNDTVVEQNWLSAMVRSATRHDAHIISCRLVNYFDRHVIDNVGHQMLNTGEIIPIGHGSPRENFDTAFENLGSCAAATLYDFSMIREIGFYDKRFSTGYEDAEFGLRAWLAGYKCIYEPSAIVYHKLGSSIKKVFNTDYALMIQNAIWYTYFKLIPWPAILISLPFIFVKQVVLILINLIFLKWSHLSVQLLSCRHTMSSTRTVIFPARKKTQGLIRRSNWEILKNQTFFLQNDFKRFNEVYLRGGKSSIEQYGDG